MAPGVTELVEVEARPAVRAIERPGAGESLHLAELSVDQAPDLIHWIDEEGRIVFVNEASCRRDGYTREEMLGLRIFDLDPSLTPGSWQEVWELLKRERSLTHEGTHRTKDGDIYPLEVSATYLQLDGRDYACVFGHDISRLKQVEEALEESELRYRTLFESASDMLIVYDARGDIRITNQAVSNQLGYTNQELVGMNVVGLRAPEEVSHFFPHLERTLRSSHSVYETVLMSKTGTRIAVEVSTQLMGQNGGRLILSISRDLTERKHAEAEQLKSKKRLAGVFEGTVAALGRLAEQRDPYTAGHQNRVALLSVAIAREIGLSPDRIEGLRVAALLHDIGKSSVPMEILTKPGRINGNEMAIIQAHPMTGYETLSDIDFPWPVAEIVKQHHERRDGSGYPLGLAGKQILVEARIIAVADVVEAISSHRPYRPALGLDVALEEIRRGQDTLFDRRVVRACRRALRDEALRCEFDGRVSGSRPAHPPGSGSGLPA